MKLLNSRQIQTN